MRIALGCKNVFLLVAFLCHRRPCADVGFAWQLGSLCLSVLSSVICLFIPMLDCLMINK